MQDSSLPDSNSNNICEIKCVGDQIGSSVSSL